MRKTLEQRLTKLTQQIIEGYPCPKCGEKVVFIQVGHGSASFDQCFYICCNAKKVGLTTQDGRWHEGYAKHKCDLEDKLPNMKGFKD